MLLNNDYVKRSDVIHVACLDCYCCATIDEFEDTTCPVKQKFMSIPAADVAPVVRCKECQYWEKVEYYPNGYKMCCRLLKAEMHGECFCSLGTRKDKKNAE